MQPFQTRVIEEKRELDLKLFRLKAFEFEPVYTSLSPAEMDRLARQYKIMEQYSAILAERIAAFV